MGESRINGLLRMLSDDLDEIERPERVEEVFEGARKDVADLRADLASLTRVVVEVESKLRRRMPLTPKEIEDVLNIGRKVLDEEHFVELQTSLEALGK